MKKDVIKTVLNDEQTVYNLLEDTKFKESKIFALDLETNSVDVTNVSIVSYSFCYLYNDIFYAYYVPIKHQKKGFLFEEEPKNLNIECALELLNFICITKKLVGHNLMFEYMVLKKYGIPITEIEMDTMILMTLIDENNLRDKGVGLKQLVRKYLNYEMTTYDSLIEDNENIAFIEIDKAKDYAIDDVVKSYELYLTFKLEEGLLDFWLVIEREMIRVLGDMCLKGVFVDTNHLNVIKKDCEVGLKKLEREIYDLAGKEFNIKSVKQLADILQTKFNIVFDKEFYTEKNNISLDEKMLNILYRKTKLDFLNKIITYRNINKIYTTYTDSLLEKVVTNRLHTNYRSLGAVSGRIISDNPNLQNLPTVDDDFKIKKFIVAENDCILLDFDYSQIELRLLAHCSQDPVMLEIYRNNGDIHKETMEFCKCKNRREAKAINFGISYGMGYKTLCERINENIENENERITEEDAKNYLERFKEKYKYVFYYKELVENFYRRNGYTMTIFGRKRRVPFEVFQKNEFNVLREVFNFVIQGSCADLLKLSMIDIHKYLKNYNNDKLYLMLTVHDEVVINCPNNLKDKVIEDVKNIMANTVKLRVPVEVDCVEGQNWYDCKNK